MKTGKQAAKELDKLMRGITKKLGSEAMRRLRRDAKLFLARQ